MARAQRRSALDGNGSRKKSRSGIQEPPLFDGNSHPAFDFLRAGRVLTARRKISDRTVPTEDGFPREAGGGVQELSLGRRAMREGGSESSTHTSGELDERKTTGQPKRPCGTAS